MKKKDFSGFCIYFGILLQSNAVDRRIKIYVIVQSIMGDTLPFGRDRIILNNPRQLVMANKVYGEESIISVSIASGNGVVTEWYREREGETEIQNLDNSKKNRTFACEIHVHDAMGYLQIAHC